MKTASIKSSKIRNVPSLRFFVLAALIFAFSLGTSFAQAPQLSLADLLIGLRSKKVSLEDRNKILTEAVRQRGITFLLNADIEKELATTGAGPDLLGVLRSRSAEAKALAAPKVVATPVPAPTPDFGFYKARADASAVKGDFTTALADYNRSLELKSDSAAIYFSRGRAHFNLRAYSQSIADYDKAIAIDPKDAFIYMSRGLAYERLGDAAKAAADFQKVVDLEPSNEQAKSSLKKIQDEMARAAELAKPKPAPVKPPEFISRGTLTADEAVKLVTPTYAPAAQRANVEGKVVVEVDIDAEGNVVAAKATNGHQLLRSAAEDAAEKSKFQPSLFDNKPIKSKGFLVYNFSLKAGR